MMGIVPYIFKATVIFIMRRVRAIGIFLNQDTAALVDWWFADRAINQKGLKVSRIKVRHETKMFHELGLIRGPKIDKC
jgi:hypothetical protein